MPNEIQKVEIPVAGASPMNLHFAAPASGKPGPGIMVFQEAFGVNGHIRNLCQRFCAKDISPSPPNSSTAPRKISKATTPTSAPSNPTWPPSPPPLSKPTPAPPSNGSKRRTKFSTIKSPAPATASAAARLLGRQRRPSPPSRRHFLRRWHRPRPPPHGRAPARPPAQLLGRPG